MITCPHCPREFHEAELTETVARFFDTHRFDPDYSPETDDSPIACIGSCNLGPMPSRDRGAGEWVTLGFIDETWQWPTWKHAAPGWQKAMAQVWGESYNLIAKLNAGTWMTNSWDEGYKWVGTIENGLISSKVCHDSIDVTVPIDAEKPVVYSPLWIDAMHALAKTTWDEYLPTPSPNAAGSDYTALAENLNKAFTYVGVK